MKVVLHRVMKFEVDIDHLLRGKDLGIGVGIKVEGKGTVKVRVRCAGCSEG